MEKISKAIGNGMILTSLHSQSSYGIPVLVCPGGEILGPSQPMPYSYLHDDLADIWGDRPAELAASYVRAQVIGSTDLELLELARLFCSQVSVIRLGP